MDIRALALLLERVVSAAVSEALDQSASIIAPGREGSQSVGQPRITKARQPRVQQQALALLPHEG